MSMAKGDDMILKRSVVKVTDETVEEIWFIGSDADHLQNAGRLTLHIGEYQLLGAVLLLGASVANTLYHHISIINDDTLFRAHFCIEKSNEPPHT